ncbi:MAG: efflux RND transporter periplasmic adaptor subunit [Nitrospirae bacterium]|nr:efflux RND transporter periplasmic adaptor subunit [Nitrospirota bacterium]
MADEDLSKLTIDKSPAPGRMKQRRRPVLIAVIAVIGIAVAVFLGRTILYPTVTVEAAMVARVYPSQAFTLLNASGYVVAQRKAAVASKITGRLVSIFVEEGQRLRKGDIVAQLESDDAAAVKEQASANLRAAGANLEQARAERADAAMNYRRDKELLAKGFISKLEYDSAETRNNKAEAAVSAAEAAVKASAAALRQAEVTLDYASIRAPFDAVVLTKNADVGDIITPLGAAANAKAAVVSIADMSSLQVEVDVSESNIGMVAMKQPCEIQLDALPDTRFRGEVYMVVPTADRTKATILVKVRFVDNDPRVLPEMSAKVAFLQRQMTDDDLRPRTAVYGDSVLMRKGRSSVFIIRDSTLVETEVTTGEKIGDMVEIRSGVTAGARIVRKPSDSLKTGTRITLSEK